MDSERSEQGQNSATLSSGKARQKKSAPPPQRASLAKLTRPILNRIHPRQRLFDALDTARSHPVIWITAPGGAGKTTLIASYLEARNISPVWCQLDTGDNDIASFYYYLGLAAPLGQAPLPVLTPEYALGLPTFSRNFFREFFSRLETPGVLVLDDYHEVAADSGLHELLKHGLDEIPPGMNVVIVSRNAPPVEFTLLRARDRLEVLAGDAVQLTEDESSAVAALRTQRAFELAEIRTLHACTQGWAAGIILMLEQANTRLEAPRLEGGFNASAAFDFFASEIFSQADAELQEFLLATAFLSKISVEAAQRLTHMNHAERILEELTRRNFFTVRHLEGSFEYHPLFRTFLINRCRAVCAEDDLQQLIKRSAGLLAEAGEVETAVVLFQQAQDWAAVTALALEQAPMLARQGRIQTLAGWLTSIPAVLREANPWVLYWLGIASMASGFVQARSYFEQAYSLFEEQDDSLPLYLTWSAIIESLILGWNDFNSLRKWIDAFDALQQSGRKSPPPAVEAASLCNYVGALVHLYPLHADWSASAERAKYLYMHAMDINSRLSQGIPFIAYNLWINGPAEAESLMQGIEASAEVSTLPPLARIVMCMWKAHIAAFAGKDADNIRISAEGLALAEATGIRVFYVQSITMQVIGYLQLNDLGTVSSLLEKMKPWCIGRGYVGEASYYWLAGILSVRQGELARGVQDLRHSLAHAGSASVSMPLVASGLALANALAMNHSTEEALQEIAAARVIAQTLRSGPMAYMCAFTEAVVRHKRSEKAIARIALQEAMELGQKMGMINLHWILPDDVATLYAIALEEEICVDYVKSAIAGTGVPAPAGTVFEHWPWPIRIHTLGRFVLSLNDQPLVISGKAQKKPLELLKALIAFGGREVPANALIDALWPDPKADGRNLFENTLFRLRKLLGRDDALIMQDGKLTLNPQLVWVDVWAFERLLGQAQGMQTAETQKALRFYQGHFLAREEERPWHLPLRGRLASKFMRHVMQLGLLWESSQLWDEAIALYQRVLELDHLAENIYRQLMHCHLQRGNHAEALNIYRRCREMLSIVLSIQPSVETETLHQQIRQTQH